MDLLRKYLLTSIAAFAPPRGRVVDAIVDDETLPEGDEPLPEDDEPLPEDDELPPEDDEPLPVDDELEPEPEQRPRSRSQRRVETVVAERNELRRQVQESEARLAALEARLNAPAAQPQQTQEEENARLALMTPEERMDYKLDKVMRMSQQTTAGAVAVVADRTDQADFRALLREKPQYKKFADIVEKKHRELTKAGTPLAREAILIYVLGETAYKNTDTPRRRSQSEQRLRSQETRPGNTARGDVRSSDRRAANSGASAAERRLANMKI